MAKNMVLTYLHLLDPEIPIESYIMDMELPLNFHQP